MICSYRIELDNAECFADARGAVGFAKNVSRYMEIHGKDLKPCGICEDCLKALRAMTTHRIPRIPATKITITRGEGPSHLCDKPHAFEGDTCWQEAEDFLRSSAVTAPLGGGYDKHDITIEFGAGTDAALTYRTRYDLTYERAPQLAALVRQEWDFYAARRTPPRMTEAQHHTYLAECNINRELWALRCAVYLIPT